MLKKKQPYDELKFYQDICEIRVFIYLLTKTFDRSHMRLISQMRDAARSAKQNIREGYRKGTLGEFKHSIRIAQGSLEELSGDMEDCLEDKLINQNKFDHFTKLFRSVSYLNTQYLKSMAKQRNVKNWKKPLETKTP